MLSRHSFWFPIIIFIFLMSNFIFFNTFKNLPGRFPDHLNQWESGFILNHRHTGAVPEVHASLLFYSMSAHFILIIAHGILTEVF